MSRIEPWTSWPNQEEVQIDILPDRPPFGRKQGMEKVDTLWKNRMISGVTNGSIIIKKSTNDNKIEIRELFNIITYRTYHLSRILQSFFNNPNHGNYQNPLIETLYITLTQFTPNEMAKKVLNKLMLNFQSPKLLIEPCNYDLLYETIKPCGFDNKRPLVIIDIIKEFIKKFPTENYSTMDKWYDGEIIEFLMNIKGIGKKTALCVAMYSLNRDLFPVDRHIRRILRRTQILSEIFLEKDELDPRKFQDAVEFLLPPSVRKSLHVNLISLGQDFCHESNPNCSCCPINKSCQFYRDNEMEKSEKRSYTHVDLFCGAGGFSSGLKKEEFRTIAAFDIQKDACSTFLLNNPEVPKENILCIDLEKNDILDIIHNFKQWKVEMNMGNIDIITAGIPCQGFSKAGNRYRLENNYIPHEDNRNYLYQVVIKWTTHFQPNYVIIENVPEMSTSGDSLDGIYDKIRKDFALLGYYTSTKPMMLNSNDFGVPQNRKRLIIIASHISVPPISIQEINEKKISGGKLKEAISDLPKLKSNDGIWYQKIKDKIVTSHVSRFNNNYDLKIFEAIMEEERFKDFIDRRPDIIQDRIKNSSYKLYSIETFSDKYRKLHYGKPSRTIVAHLNRDGNGYIHPKQPRSITPREAMRIQGFEDHHIFCGNQGSQFIQIGNAIPPPLVKAIGSVIKQKLNEYYRNN